MRIVVLSNRDLKGGGAYLAAFRLVKALRSNGVEAYMLVKEKYSDEEFIADYTRGSWWKKYWAVMLEYAERLYLFTQIKLKKNRFNFSTGKWGLDVTRHPLVRDADIIHLHWINKSFVSLETIQNLGMEGKKLVWTMHDMWPFTGGCHYSDGCDRFKIQCETCPMLADPSTDDHSNRIWKRKKAIYNDVQIEGVTCSTWLEHMAANSSLWPAARVRTINNPIDTDFFSPDPEGTPTDSEYRTLLFVARNVNDHRKGIDLLRSALDLLMDKRPHLRSICRLILVGEVREEVHFPIHHEYVGLVSGSETIRELYRRSDIFVLPSREDNLPNTLVEASACGLASVAFSIGGIPEMILDGESGHLVKPLDERQLAAKLYDLLSMSDEELNGFKVMARELALKKYSPKAVARQYVDLYEKMIAGEV